MLDLPDYKMKKIKAESHDDEQKEEFYINQKENEILNEKWERKNTQNDVFWGHDVADGR